MSMFKDYTNKIIRYIELNNRNADNHDVMRSATTSGAVSAYCDSLRLLHHEVDHGDWEDNGCLRVSYLKIDGNVIVRNSEIDYYAVSDLLRAEVNSAEEILKSTHQEASRIVDNPEASRDVRMAWYFTHMGEMEMAMFLGLIDEDRWQELAEEWKTHKTF